MKLDCSGMEPGCLLATNPDSISAVIKIVFVCGDPVVNALIVPLFYSDTPLFQLIIIWSAIAYNTWSPLILIYGTMTTQWVSQDCLHTVTTLSWPTRSPDLSPIEHIWDLLGWRNGYPTSLNELEAKLQ
ncbi:transposable element Tcb2 transposase [Trichonephila clavipes]|nr:transposable element Tcb2 transposase [Trichonephila clavipes]